MHGMKNEGDRSIARPAQLVHTQDQIELYNNAKIKNGFRAIAARS